MRHSNECSTYRVVPALLATRINDCALTKTSSCGYNLRLGEQMKTSIRFYFDYISSNAYLAWPKVKRLAEKYGRTLEPIPVLFAGYLEHYGQLGPAEIPAKTFWMVKNNLRKAAILGIPLNPPIHHPWNPLLSLRLSSLPMSQAQQFQVIDGFFNAAWKDGQHISDPQVSRKIANDAGLDPEKALQQTQSAEIKQQLRQQTDDSIVQGVFGVPTMIVDSELFWGFDDLPYFEQTLAGKDPLQPAELARWHGATPSAQRKKVR